eukprot:TRINITY_DN39648_c0_g1_i2.p1 TRINITY_DN39648_c0_g1~~TRINITY_DN39648_c0_g1_i2.p1  ORF type:complete len:151 (-),score=34.32 TRINITY_DN39648_c0_g1_i2:78-530(-)
MTRRPPRSTLSSSSAASDVYKRQQHGELQEILDRRVCESSGAELYLVRRADSLQPLWVDKDQLVTDGAGPVYGERGGLYGEHGWSGSTRERLRLWRAGEDQARRQAIAAAKKVVVPKVQGFSETCAPQVQDKAPLPAQGSRYSLRNRSKK